MSDTHSVGRVVPFSNARENPHDTERIERRFSAPDHDPMDDVQWERRAAVITDHEGATVFEQRNVEVPVTWSQTATNIVASKYFRGQLDTPKRENSVRQMISRVVDALTSWGQKQGYFPALGEARTFHAELTALLLSQRAAFNSPVWFNCGVEDKPQCSACFILSVDDSMESILDWYRNEGMIFKGGSGAGVNLSKIRSSKEKLSSGGTASGPLSFMKAADASAGVIKSGGKTRRAAKLVCLDADHPDIEDFIKCKVEEEKKAWALIDAGYDGSLDGPAYGSVFFQNANNSVRAGDDFMRAVANDGQWYTRYVTTGEVAKTYRARDLMRAIAEAAHACGDPGMQFDDTINRWHTRPNSGRIGASNPCSEFMSLDNTACNLASINLLKFLNPDGSFAIDDFRHAVRILITAQDIIVDNSSYPTPEIAANAHANRELGLGYANLGALLMALGLPYDSDRGRAYAAGITALMTGEAYLRSAGIASVMGAFENYGANREPMLDVIAMHRADRGRYLGSNVPDALRKAALNAWDSAYQAGVKHGYRNSQTTLIAPTGTIAFMMDCDTTGIEPDIALVKYKKLVGGGQMKIVNGTVGRALEHLNYNADQVKAIIDHIDAVDTIEGAPGLKPEHLPVFDCAFKPRAGSRSIHYMGHIRMIAAAQPFLSGAISKTANMPTSATVDEVAQAYMTAWQLGVKAIAIYRDGSKRTQPLNTGKQAAAAPAAPPLQPTATQVLSQAPKPSEPMPARRRLPEERKSLTHKFDIERHQGYITVSMYEDGKPGELFVNMSKQGSTISGLMDAFAISVSFNLQYGVPLRFLIAKFAHMRFEPSGFTHHPEIPIAKSIVDYIFRWMALKFLDRAEQVEIGLQPATRDNLVDGENEIEQTGPQTLSLVPERRPAPAVSAENFSAFVNQQDAPVCADCGEIMVRNGACYKCLNCGGTSGCS